MFKYTSLVVLLFVSGAVFAQTDQASTEKEKRVSSSDKPEPAGLLIAEGATARLSLTTPLSSKLSEVGDSVNAVLYEPVLTSDGRVAIAKGTQFFGRVSQVKKAGKGQKESSLKLTFENMLMPYGTERIAVTVVAIDDYGTNEKYKAKNGEGAVSGGRSGGRTARNAGTGAGLGSIGGILGGLPGMAIGAGAGAVAGVLMTKGNDLKLGEGTILRIRFEKAIDVPAFEDDRRGIKRIQ